jgi:hypothetical protein
VTAPHPPRPEVRCPRCGHGINLHTIPEAMTSSPGGCFAAATDGNGSCACDWDPDTVAHTLLYGDLTRLAAL